MAEGRCRCETPNKEGNVVEPPRIHIHSLGDQRLHLCEIFGGNRFTKRDDLGIFKKLLGLPVELILERHDVPRESIVTITSDIGRGVEERVERYVLVLAHR